MNKWLKRFLVAAVWVLATYWSYWLFFVNVDRTTSLELPDWAQQIESDEAVLTAWREKSQTGEFSRVYDEELIARLAVNYPTAYFAETVSRRLLGKGGEQAAVRWVVSVDGALVTYPMYATGHVPLLKAYNPYIDSTTRTLRYSLAYDPIGVALGLFLSLCVSLGFTIGFVVLLPEATK